MPTPSKFTADRRQALLEAPTFRASERTCAREAGIDHETLRRWLKRGEESQDDGNFRDFFEAWEAATSHPRVRALRSLYKAVPDDVRAAQWFLERSEEGFEPPNTRQAPPKIGPVVVALSFHDGEPVAALGGGTVITVGEPVPDEQDSPADTPTG